MSYDSDPELGILIENAAHKAGWRTEEDGNPNILVYDLGTVRGFLTLGSDMATGRVGSEIYDVDSLDNEVYDEASAEDWVAGITDLVRAAALQATHAA